MKPVCDKCNKEVVKHEDVTILDAIVNSTPNQVAVTRPRHIKCDPSRSRYINVQELTNNNFVQPEGPTNIVERRIQEWTKAYIMLQTICGRTHSTIH